MRPGLRCPAAPCPAAVGVAAVALVLLLAPSAEAEPRFALREGMHCATCHVNQTGGGMRTPWGRTFSQVSLPSQRGPGFLPLGRQERFELGANLRSSARFVSAARTSIEEQQYRSAPQASFEMAEANVYLRAQLLEDRVDVYVDQTVAPEAAANREAFVLLRGLVEGAWLKAGRFLLPHGLRIYDDTAFIRQQTGFTYANQDLGVEVGLTRGAFTGAVALTNGTLGAPDSNLLKQVSAHTEGVWRHGRIGASFAWNDTSSDAFAARTLTSSVHGGLQAGRLMVLGTLSWIRLANDANIEDQIALFTTADFEALKGLWLHLGFEAFDPRRSLEENERDRFIAGLSWFPRAFLEIRGVYRHHRDIPQRVEGNGQEALVELHGFF